MLESVHRPDDLPSKGCYHWRDIVKGIAKGGGLNDREGCVA